MFLTIPQTQLAATEINHQKNLTLTKRQLCDLECLLNGAYLPLSGFLKQEDYVSVCHTMRLRNGSLFPIPITLDVSEAFAKSLAPNEQIVLTDDENTPLALLTVTDCWCPDKEEEALLVYGTQDLKHPGVQYLLKQAGTWYLGGPLTKISLPIHYDFIEYRHTPDQLKQLFNIYGWTNVIAFQTRNPMHRAHYELTLRASKATNAHLLIHPVVGMTKSGDVDYVTRVQCYQHILEEYPKQNAMLSLLPLAMRMAGPREAIWHAIIRKNYGVTHFIIGRDHAGPGLDSKGLPFYDPYAAQHMAQQYADEIGINMVTFPAIVYATQTSSFVTVDEISTEDTVEDISGTELRRKLESRLEIPAWFSFPKVIQTLQRAYPPKVEQGYTLFFTGLSGAGKSTLAKAICAKLRETCQRSITLLDGDIVRKELSSDLGFSKKDRDTHIQRMGYVAAEITKHKGIAICAAIAPYTTTRQAIRNTISQYGGFIEVYVATPIAICKQRDTKGLYKKAELGFITDFTGISAPYEEPTHAELIIDTSETTISDAVNLLLSKIEELGYIQTNKTPMY